MAARRRAPLGRPRRRPRATTAAAGACCARAPARCPRRCSTGAVEREDGTLLVPLDRGAAPRRCAELRVGARSTAPRAALPRSRSARRRPAARAPGRRPTASTASALRARGALGPRRSAPPSTQLPGAEPRRRARCRSTRGSSSTLDALPRPARRRGRRLGGRRARRRCAPSTTRRPSAIRALARDDRRADRRDRRPRSAASSRRSSGPACATRSTPGATFLADEQGLGKTVEALAALEADDAFPAVVVCPASLKLNWERETTQLAAAPLGRGRSRAAARSRRPAEITILNYEIVAAHREALGAPAPARARRRRVALRARTRRPSARRRCAGWPRRVAADGAAPGADRHAGAQPRRRADRAAARDRPAGGLRLGRALLAPVPGAADRGAPALAPAPALLRAAAEVRGPAAAARQAPGRRAGRARQRARVPARRAGRHRLAARAAARPVASSTRRSPRRCAPSASRSSGRCSASRRAASSRAALAWIDDFLASGEPLVVFARHVEVQRGGARALPGRAAPARRATRSASATTRSRAFQEPDGPQLHRLRDARRRARASR